MGGRAMGSAWRVAVCLACGVCALVFPVVTFAEEPASSTGSMSLSGSPLVGEGVGALAEAPTIDNALATNATEHDVSLEITINPRGGETIYDVWLECEADAPEGATCEPLPGGRREQGGPIVAGSADQSVTVDIAGLQPGHRYGYTLVATNFVGKAETPQLSFQTAPLGSCKPICPYISSISLAMYRASSEYAAEAPAREATRKREAKEQSEREAAARSPSQLQSDPNSSQAETTAGSVLLASRRVAVQRGHLSLVKLECLGYGRCHGKLILYAKAAHGKKKRRGTTMLGSAHFSMPGDSSSTVDVGIDGAGRALLRENGGLLSARLTIVEVMAGPALTQVTTVRLVQGLSRKRER